jgi:hypothetical protein|nr:MAG TPA: Sf6 terminase small subunit gp1, octamer, DNA-binding, CAPS buffer.65A [Caudoviricetes sp.]
MRKMEKKSKNKNGKEKKKTAKKSENKRGRPTIITPEIIAKLEQAFSLGCSDLEACIYADIGKTALYDYQEKNPEFTERKEALKQKLVLKARTIVANALEKEDENTAKWYLERKARDEFAAKQEVAVGNLESSPFKIEIID